MAVKGLNRQSAAQCSTDKLALLDRRPMKLHQTTETVSNWIFLTPSQPGRLHQGKTRDGHMPCTMDLYRSMPCTVGHKTETEDKRK